MPKKTTKKVTKKQLYTFVERICRMDIYDIDDEENLLNDMEDALRTMNRLIEDARKMFGIRNSESCCEDCGDEVDEDGMNCPDGAFICRACFDAGHH